MYSIQAHHFGILLGAINDLGRKLRTFHPIKNHKLHNAEKQHHDVLTVWDEVQLLSHDWRDFVPHRHH